MVYQETRPRGPVAAQYNSPGPIYQLPPLVGINNHDPQSTHGRRPAFSFGIRHGKIKDDASPGPVYNPDARYSRTGQDYSPRYSLYGRPKDLKSWTSYTPGPGAYQPESAGPTVSPRGPSYSFGARTSYRGKDNNPGPNTYALPSLLGKSSDSTKKNAPQYSQYGRSTKGGFHEDLSKAPGPGTYPVTDPNVYKHKSPVYSQIGRTKVVGDNSMKPGPGAHNPQNVSIHLPTNPAPSFGVKHSEYKINPIIAEVDN